jgi:hypothetical protein
MYCIHVKALPVPWCATWQADSALNDFPCVCIGCIIVIILWQRKLYMYVCMHWGNLGTFWGLPAQVWGKWGVLIPLSHAIRIALYGWLSGISTLISLSLRLSESQWFDSDSVTDSQCVRSMISCVFVMIVCTVTTVCMYDIVCVYHWGRPAQVCWRKVRWFDSAPVFCNL